MGGRSPALGDPVYPDPGPDAASLTCWSCPPVLDICCSSQPWSPQPYEETPAPLRLAQRAVLGLVLVVFWTTCVMLPTGLARTIVDKWLVWRAWDWVHAPWPCSQSLNLRPREGPSVGSPLSWITALLWWRGLYNSVKLWAMPCRATQDGWVIVKSSDKSPVHRRREWQTTSLFFMQESCEQYKKAKWYDTGKWASHVWRYLICYWGKSRGQLLISPETMRQLGQSRNDAQLWMCLGVKVKRN